MASQDDWKFETRAVHVGQDPDPTSGAVVPPITLATSFRQEKVDQHGRYDYSRAANPNRDALEAVLASLEGATDCVAFSSGMAAADAVLRGFCKPGSHLIHAANTYGGTVRLMSTIHSAVERTAADMSDPTAVKEALRPDTAMVWIESPTNPVLDVIDIAAVAEQVKGTNALLVVDNTFATPYLTRPLELGADIVVHSTTKYLSGHSDVLGGAVITNDHAMAEGLRFTQFAAGAVPSPFDCFLLTRSIKTLAVRMERQCDNAEAIAAFLEAHPRVTDVNYPFLASHPRHEVARRQMRRGGGVISFVVDGGQSAAMKVIDSLRVFISAESLGAVESLVEHPGAVSQTSLTSSLTNFDPGLIRMSVGIEAVDDLIADLAQALDA